ncbi:MAG TPA: hypothetical protein PKD61_28980, partial [Polyangiaceae bacterium]|nr:hypothetical protein [Polyangiaceae bacterium]
CGAGALVATAGHCFSESRFVGLALTLLGLRVADGERARSALDFAGFFLTALGVRALLRGD